MGGSALSVQLRLWFCDVSQFTIYRFFCSMLQIWFGTYISKYSHGVFKDQSLYITEAFKRYRLKNCSEWALDLFKSYVRKKKAFPKTDYKNCIVCSEPRSFAFLPSSVDKTNSNKQVTTFFSQESSFKIYLWCSLFGIILNELIHWSQILHLIKPKLCILLIGSTPSQLHHHLHHQRTSHN